MNRSRSFFGPSTPFLEHADSFPSETKLSIKKIEMSISMAQDLYDFAARKLVNDLNTGLAEIKAHLVKLQAKGVDISLWVAILKQAGIELDVADAAPAPKRRRRTS